MWSSKETTIVINGVLLTDAQSMTVRVALESFAGDLVSDGLGDDKIGKQITKAYLERISEVRSAMFPTTPPPHQK